MLTTRKRKFVEVYAQTGNASLAARQAGFSPKSASSYSSTLLKNDKEVIEALEIERRRLQDIIRIEREELYPSKDLYVKEAFSRSKTVTHAPTASKYYELGGKALGYLSEEKQNEAPMFQIVHNELNITFITARSSKFKTPKTCNFFKNKPAKDPDIYQNVETSVETINHGDSVNDSGLRCVGGEGEAPTQGSNLNLIPLHKSLTILNSPSNESINSLPEANHA